METTLRLQFKPEEIGKAALYQSCKLAGVELPCSEGSDMAKELGMEQARLDGE